MTAWALLAVLVCGACTQARSDAASVMSERRPTRALAPVARDALCITKGELADDRVRVPTMRGFALTGAGDAAQVRFTYRGDSAEARALANGQRRRQIGLKLRAQDSCNVVYVMWRLDPEPALDVSVKINPGTTTHDECGANGYTKIRAHERHAIPAFEVDRAHTLRAEIVDDELTAWVDGALAFHGTLPPAARSLAGPAGLRSDNVAFDLDELATQRPVADAPGAGPVCAHEHGSAGDSD